MSLAKGARQRGVRIVEGVEVTGVAAETRGSRRTATGVRVRHEGEERIACEVVVNCAGQWARQFGALAGVNVPLYSAEHFYIVTDRIDGRAPDAAGDARPRRLHLLQGGSRRPGDGRLRAEGQAVERGPDPGDLPVPAARRGLGPVRDPDDRTRCTARRAWRRREVQDAAQRPGELHARRQLHPRRGAGAGRLLRLRRLQLGRHRQLAAAPGG